MKRDVSPVNQMTTIGVLSPLTGGLYYGRVLAGINRELNAVGGRIVFIQTLDAGISSDEVVAAPDFRKPIAWDHLDGVISIATGTKGRYLRQLLERDIPVVVASDVIEGLEVPSVVPDNAGGIAAAVAHLVGHGHTRIGFAANLVQSDMRQRKDGYRAALAAHALELRDEWQFEAPDNGELGGTAVARQLLQRPLAISALVLATDRNALGCITALTERGVRVPDDLAIVGFDGIDAGTYSTPPLTTVGQRFDVIGAAAAKLLLAKLAGEPVADGPHPVPADLLVRESCGCGATTELDRVHPAGEAAFWHAEAALQLDRSQRRERWMREQYEIGIRLLDHDLSAPQQLEWLAATRVTSAELALWDGDPASGRVQIAGTYDRDGHANTTVGTTMPVTAFPTPTLLARSDANPDEVTIVVPVAARGQDFGLLAVVSEVDSLSANGRETHNQWAALLTTALDQQLLHDQLRRSEERYSLWALATDDGLWDWDAATNRIYYSGRCMEMLGHDYRSVTGPPSIWLDRVHPDDRPRMRAAMARAATPERDTVELEHRVQGHDGEYRRVVLRALPVGPLGAPATRVVGSIHDVEARRQLEERLRHGALYDEVTGLPNRRLFLERLAAAIAGERGGGRRYAVAFFDLDGFKLVNDSLGHLAGDRLLAEVGSRLRRRLRRSDVAARFGGDEFAILLHDIPASAVAATVADVLADIRQPVELDGHTTAVSASTGITTSDFDYSTPDEVIRDADLAMYRAKATRSGSAVLFDVSLRVDGLVLSTTRSRPA
jgi:diguanylate cyclase (GGDEF)-like protein/PAS domain S-box-containing protein